MEIKEFSMKERKKRAAVIKRGKNLHVIKKTKIPKKLILKKDVTKKKPPKKLINKKKKRKGFSKKKNVK